MPKVSIIVVNWNNYKDTKDCLVSIKNLNYKNYEVIVVDNGSTTNATKDIQNEFSEFTYVYNTNNLGYAGGLNSAIRQILNRPEKPSFFWFLNNDVIVDQNSLDILINEMLINKDVGFATPTIYIGNPNNFEEYNRERSFACLNLFIGGYSKKLLSPSKTIKISGKSKCHIAEPALLIRYEALKDIGFFTSEDYFMYNEEADRQELIRKTNWNLLYVGAAKVWHNHQQKEQRLGSWGDYYDARNFLIFIKKFYPLLLPYEILISFIRKGSMKILRGEWKRFKFILMGIYDGTVGRVKKVKK